MQDDAGTRTFAYHLAGTLELQSETYDTAGLFPGQSLTYPIDTTTAGAKGRSTGFTLGSALTTTYAYQADGRLTSVAGGGATFTYGYVANSHLVGTVTTTSFTSGTYTDTRTYDSQHDWTKSRATAFGSTAEGGFTNTFDPVGHVTAVAKTGAIYSAYGNGAAGLKTNYAYDDRSQLRAEQTLDATNSAILTGRNNGTAASPGFTYDHMGNRVTATHNGNLSSYTVNALNQYTGRTIPPVVDVALLSSAAPVKVSDAAATPALTDTLAAATSGLFFFDSYNHTNTANASSGVYLSLSVQAGIASPVPLPAYLPPSNFTLKYDADGNLTDDGRWAYGYNLKNQLVSVATSTAAPAAAPQLKYLYTYDYLGRRIRKVDYTWSGSAWIYATEERYIYNGWNLAAVFSVSSLSLSPVTLTLQRTFVWGLDISGPGQGAGGIGGLLLIKETGNATSGLPAGSFLPVYDTNGNIHGMITTASVTFGTNSPLAAGSLAAVYEYDAFGNVIRESGAYASVNPFQFSTKFTDIETGLVYYGHRYYSPSLGRFINRDPIEEDGGINLYAFCRNNAITGWDLLGNDATGQLYHPFETYAGFDPNHFYMNTVDGLFTFANGKMTPGMDRGPVESTYTTGDAALQAMLAKSAWIVGVEPTSYLGIDLREPYQIARDNAAAQNQQASGQTTTTTSSSGTETTLNAGDKQTTNGSASDTPASNSNPQTTNPSGGTMGTGNTVDATATAPNNSLGTYTVTASRNGTGSMGVMTDNSGTLVSINVSNSAIVPQSPATNGVSATKGLGWGLLASASGAAGMGNGNPGAAGTASVGAGMFINGGGANLGVYASAGGVAGKHVDVNGVGAGVGLGAFLTNAGNAQSLSVTTNTAFINVGFVWDIGVSISWGNGIWIVEVNPPGSGVGGGIGGAAISTTTVGASTPNTPGPAKPSVP